MLDANTTHIALTLEGVSVDLQVLSFIGREALNHPFCFDIELVSARPDLKLEELLHKPGCLTFGATGKGTWMGPISRLSWYGGSWADSAQGALHWFNVDNPAAETWQQPAEQKTLHLSAPHEEALQRQLKEHFVYQWWSQQDAVSFIDAARFLDEGMNNGFTEAQELAQYLSLRALYPATQAPDIPLHASSEDRLTLVRKHLTRDDQDKEPLT